MRDISFGKRLKHLRKRLQITQMDAAKRIGISYSALQDNEGGRWPNRNNMDKYLRFYRCDRNWLLTGLGNPYINGAAMFEPGESEVVEGDGLYGKTRHHDIDGTKYAVTTFGEGDKKMASFDFSEAVGALKDIYDSNDPLLIHTVVENLSTFRLTAALKKKVESVEERMAALEKQCGNTAKIVTDLTKNGNIFDIKKGRRENNL